MARLHQPAPCIPSPLWMSVIAWSVLGSVITAGGLCIAGGMGWL